MPEILIKEIDNTTGGEVSATNYTAVIFGRLDFKPDKGTLVGENFEHLFEGPLAEGEFEEYIDVTAPGNNITHIIVPALCALGMKVLYVREKDIINNELNHIVEKLARFADKGRYEYRFIVPGDYVRKTESGETDWSDNFNKALAKIASERSDVLALMDLPESKKAVSSSEAEDYFAKRIEEIQDPEAKKEVILGKDVAGGAPWGSYGANHVPNSFGYLAAFMDHINTYKEWYAMSGATRGQIPYNFIPLVDYGDADIAVLQRRTPREHLTTVGVNAICEIRPHGNIVWGNRTLLPLESTDLRASHFLNIRHLCITLKQLLYRVCRQLTFEPNSDLLWTEFCDLVRPTLEEMKTNQGIAGYKLIRKKVSKKAKLIATIRIVPIEAVEDFDLTVELADSIEVEGE